MRTEHLARRITVLTTGLCIMALGVAFSIKADMGTSPISSVPYTVSMFAPLSVGTATIIMHCAFILLQIILLRRKYNPLQLFQLPVALVFGALTDAALSLLEPLEPSGYAESCLCCIAGIILVAAGVSAEVNSDTVPLAGEGFALALSSVSGLKFGTAKVVTDSSLVTISLILSVIFLGNLGGVREGTVAAALLVGTIARKLNAAVLPLREKYL